MMGTIGIRTLKAYKGKIMNFIKEARKKQTMFRQGKQLLDLIPKTRAIRGKTDKLAPIKIKNFVL